MLSVPNDFKITGKDWWKLCLCSSYTAMNATVITVQKTSKYKEVSHADTPYGSVKRSEMH